FQRHRRLKGAAFRSEHFRTCQSQVFYLGRAQGRNCRGGGEQHDQAQWLNKWKPNYTSMGIAFFGNHLNNLYSFWVPLQYFVLANICWNKIFVTSTLYF
ncbi:hypothetical protein, partial [Nitrosomonas sp. Nm34]|uniref:hypothetical protein n=1 Tax=Nitrosomonas sp. Nm34 TaxID=1881055 RepID=UPI001C313463